MRAFRVGFGVALLLILFQTSPSPSLAGEKFLEFERFRGIPVAGVAIRGIPGGGAPWTITEGQARLDDDGTLEVEVVGLVLAAGPSAGTNPINQFIATLSCVNADGTVNNINTNPVPATSTGDARIKQVITRPNTCLGPIVFVRGVIPARGNPWFAISGF